MQAENLSRILDDLQRSSDEILQVILISKDGLALCQSESVTDYDLTAALCTELRLTCDTVLSSMQFGQTEEIFLRSRNGCLSIWPVMDMVLACICSPSQHCQRLQMQVWKCVAMLNSALSKPDNAVM